MAFVGGGADLGVQHVKGRHATQDRNHSATVYVGGLSENVSEALLWELMTQVGRVKHVYIPRDRVSGSIYGYGFVEFRTEVDAVYASRVLHMVKLFGKPIRVKLSSMEREKLDVGANLYVSNLHEDVDEKALHDIFSSFGDLVDTPHVARDISTGESKHYAFIRFSSFQASDTALQAMHGQYISGKPISVQYAFKKDSKERHGTQAERVLADAAAQNNILEQFQNSSRYDTLPGNVPAQASRGELPRDMPPPPLPNFGIPGMQYVPGMPPNAGVHQASSGLPVFPYMPGPSYLPPGMPVPPAGLPTAAPFSNQPPGQ
mmetsp:Transcript_1984/g.3528  ORF Transcript_1984/g.3528 Transcript_1984/m.3528 type:complete len:317 (+) Transcript_1984:18-968(+)